MEGCIRVVFGNAATCGAQGPGGIQVDFGVVTGQGAPVCIGGMYGQDLPGIAGKWRGNCRGNCREVRRNGRIRAVNFDQPAPESD